jgi:hypothetical protein
MAAFWAVAPCRLVEVYGRFKGACCLHHYSPDEGCSKHLIKVSNFYQTTRGNNTEKITFILAAVRT